MDTVHVLNKNSGREAFNDAAIPNYLHKRKGYQPLRRVNASSPPVMEDSSSSLPAKP